MRRHGARWWYANGKTARWKSVTVADDYVIRKSRRGRSSSRRPRQPNRGHSDECRRRPRPAIHGENVINRCGHRGGRRNEKRAVEMAERWKAWKSKNRIPPLSTAPWKSRKGSEISTFPQLRRRGRGKVENQKQVSHFPTAILLSLRKNRKTRPTASAKKRDTSNEVTMGTFLTRLDRRVIFKSLIVKMI